MVFYFNFSHNLSKVNPSMAIERETETRPTKGISNIKKEKIIVPLAAKDG